MNRGLDNAFLIVLIAIQTHCTEVAFIPNGTLVKKTYVTIDLGVTKVFTEWDKQQVLHSAAGRCNLGSVYLHPLQVQADNIFMQHHKYIHTTHKKTPNSVEMAMRFSIAQVLAMLENDDINGDNEFGSKGGDELLDDMGEEDVQTTSEVCAGAQYAYGPGEETVRALARRCGGIHRDLGRRQSGHWPGDGRYAQGPWVETVRALARRCGSTHKDLGRRQSGHWPGDVAVLTETWGGDSQGTGQEMWQYSQGPGEETVRALARRCGSMHVDQFYSMEHIAAVTIYIYLKLKGYLTRICRCTNSA